MEDSNVLSLSKALDRVSIHDINLLTTKTRLRKKDLKWLFTLNLGDPSEPGTIVALAAVEIVINIFFGISPFRIAYGSLEV